MTLHWHKDTQTDLVTLSPIELLIEAKNLSTNPRILQFQEGPSFVVLLFVTFLCREIFQENLLVINRQPNIQNLVWKQHAA